MTTPQAPAGPLRVELVAPDSVRRGERVAITIRLTNTGDRPLDVSLVGREIAFDIVVRQEHGPVLWRRLADTPVQSMLQIRTLRAGESLELRDDWRQQDQGGGPVPPGTYVLRGLVLTEHRESLATPFVRLTILPE
jgi:hypothetical protein